MELNSMYEDELRQFFEDRKEKAFRGTQLFTFFHDKKRYDVENSNLSAKAISLIKDEEINKIEIFKSFDSDIDETRKMLFKLKDGNLIEGVLMEYKHGYSQCVSTQVGCRMGCDFCASTKSGLVRNLSAGEMLGQVYEIENKYNIKISNFILMGSGEPLDNFDEVIRFIKLLHDEKGHNTSYRNITISTCGVADKIYDLADLNLPINLAVSLHQTNDKDRSALMPINRRFNLAELKKSLEYYVKKTNNRITFEYTMIKNQNDGIENIDELYSFAKNLKCHINLIPLNPIEEFDEKRPSKAEINDFKNKLEKKGFNVTIRRELGSDISASCGQLRRKIEVKWMKVVSATNVGNYRKNNEDSYYVNESKNLYVLADGMGGHLAGERASKMATEIIGEDFAGEREVISIDDAIEILSSSIRDANKKIYDSSQENEDYRGMGTTLSSGLILDDVLIYSNIGDSRIYRINEEMEQITQDDSFVNYLIEIGEITEEEAKNHPKKNVLTKAMGTTSDIEVIVNTLNIKDKDVLLFCSDGLTNMVPDEEIFKIVKENSPEEARDMLLDLALKNGGMDNITFILVFNE